MEFHSIRRSVALALTATALSGATAVAQTAPVVDVGSPKLLAKGAGVSLPVTVTCEGPAGYVFVTLSQRVSQNRVIAGYGWSSVTCDGVSHSYTVTVTASGFPTALAFKPGAALLGGGLSHCDENGCTYTPIGPLEVRISH